MRVNGAICMKTPVSMNRMQRVHRMTTVEGTCCGGIHDTLAGTSRVSEGLRGLSSASWGRRGERSSGEAARMDEDGWADDSRLVDMVGWVLLEGSVTIRRMLSILSFSPLQSYVVPLHHSVLGFLFKKKEKFSYMTLCRLEKGLSDRASWLS